ncbi:hypothetical protein DKM44_06035 [Deinococcus irradiatisoli]|uniref:Uncharacterized protein n=1 Tax=Deinococcus irradiatisoli TaxID=2202254 RepID=A0A2Z3JMB0_9DEIO|nr:hypothetical protein [Deinococcus irradiatisoli]AWN22838.1 hypothetical protein DKM44_06035 [Deinococcus irradiatisoli]
MQEAVSDGIHGTLPALEVAMADFRGQAPDLLVCLGNVGMTGLWPNVCLQAVEALNCPVVLDNAAEALLWPWAALQPRGLPDEREIYEPDAWSHVAVGHRERGLVQAYQPTVSSLPEVLAFHGRPERNTEVLDAATPEGRLLA